MTGAELKELRKSLKLSAAKAAKLLGVHLRTYQRWEKANRLAMKMRWVKVVLQASVLP